MGANVLCSINDGNGCIASVIREKSIPSWERLSYLLSKINFSIPLYIVTMDLLARMKAMYSHRT